MKLSDAKRQESTMRLKDKIAIVVGAGTNNSRIRTGLGNGSAAAVTFAREGAKVLLVDQRAESLEEPARLIKEAGGEAAMHVADISDEAQCEGLVKACIDRFGRVDVLHNNVGIGPGTGGDDSTVLEMTPANFNKMMTVNVLGMALTIKYALPSMCAQKSGSIVNISSGAGLIAMPIAAYSCSKAAVHALTQHTAGLGGPDGVRCNCVVVGSVDNRFARGTPWDVANASLFLHSEEARFINALLLPLDGGSTANLSMLAPDGGPPKGGLPRDF
jgi:NAD(P)-dependent dehydrogenase (short-subunit alcohol dehydrogenase family)